MKKKTIIPHDKGGISPPIPTIFRRNTIEIACECRHRMRFFVDFCRISRRRRLQNSLTPQNTAPPKSPAGLFAPRKTATRAAKHSANAVETANRPATVTLNAVDTRTRDDRVRYRPHLRPLPLNGRGAAGAMKKEHPMGRMLLL